MIRLNRYLALCGIASRRKCETLIRDGRVALNGRVVKSLSVVVNEKNNIVTVDGRRVFPPKDFIYILMLLLSLLFLLYLRLNQYR